MVGSISHKKNIFFTLLNKERLRDIFTNLELGFFFVWFFLSARKDHFCEHIHPLIILVKDNLANLTRLVRELDGH